MKQDRPPDTVRDYLAALQRAMKAQGCKPGLIADALADCEEHLNNEIAMHPGLSEADVLAHQAAAHAGQAPRLQPGAGEAL